VKPFALAVALSCSLVAGGAAATGFEEVGGDLRPRDKTEYELHGGLRMRAEVLSNLDLDRGYTPSGQPLFPVPSGGGQNLTYADMRLRTDFAAYAVGGGVAVKTRIDVLDNVALGGNPAGIPSASSTQRSDGSGAFRIKRAWGEARTPFGVLAAGRMGNAWGLGMLANGGDCADCDSGDAQDRIAFVTPLAGLIWAAAYDFSWVGPTAWRRDEVRRVGWAPSTQVHTITFASLRWHDPAAVLRRTKAGKATLDFGAYVSHRWQTDDAPYEYLSIASSAQPSTSPIVPRGFRATALDGWARFIAPDVRVELEIAYLMATVDQPALLPGVRANGNVTSKQLGVAMQSDFGGETRLVSAGLDAGYASGDPAPGFGAVNTSTSAPLPKAGDLDGAQANLTTDRRVDNFRFHPDYRIDRILFREIIGTVTDAIYARPHARVDLWRTGTGTLRLMAAGVVSFANEASSTPSGNRPLGIELDPTLAYASRDGFGVAFEYAVLFPLAGLDNPRAHLNARPAQLFRLRLSYLF
jgi:uncharacterized protein (TIGR04551 family)